MTIKHLSLLAVLLIGSLTASAQTTKRIPLPASQNPSGADLPFSAAVWAGDTLYVSGWLDPDIKTHPDTTSQTVSLLQDVQTFLQTQKLTLGDVVMMHVYLGPILRKTARWTSPEQGPDIPNSSGPKTNRTSTRAPRCRWSCPLALAGV
jgi:enamine deaminase RidA (YjgF/YER057c/UK114 family)